MAHAPAPPPRSLAEAMDRLGEGALGLRLEPDDDDDDASAALSDSFNRMAARIDAKFMELRETRDYLEGIVESSADIIITVNPRGYVYTFNRGAEDTLGYSRGEVIGRQVEMLFSDPHEQGRAKRRLRGVDNVVNFETHLRTKSGEVRDVMLTLTRLRDPAGRTIGSFGIGKDLTEENRLQEQLVHAERFAAIGQAVAGIQHALKNMLNALKGGAYMVGIGLSKDDRELLQEGWTMVQEGINNLTSMSTHMLSYVRAWQPKFDSVALDGLVGELEKIFRPVAQERGVGFRAEVADDPPPVLCDASLVHAALMDLLSNALDACVEKAYPEDETPEIVIRAHPSSSGSAFVLAVRDNGCGMPPEIRANVFTPFFSTKRSLGTGLGLALTARTIRLHGGEIDVESTPHEGSEFRITLPTDGPRKGMEEPDGQEGAGRR